MSIVFFDLDGVLADFNGGVRKLIDLEALPQPPLDNYNILSGSSMRPIRAIVTKDPDFWHNLDVIEPIATVFLNTPGAYVCTSPGFPVSATPKIWWCKEQLGVPEKDVVLASRKGFLAAHDRILVDDDAEHCSEFCRWGGESILIERPWSYHKIPKEELHQAVVHATEESLPFVLPPLRR